VETGSTKGWGAKQHMYHKETPPKRRTPNIYKFLQKWRQKLAKLNDKIELFYKAHYKVQDHNIKPPKLRTTEITIVPYGHRKWKRKRLARQKCLTRGEPNNTHLTLVAYTTTQPKYTKLTFDTDSYEIMVDNCCSQSITNNIKDYIDPPTNTSVQIKGYNGTSTTTTKNGTVLWKWSDDKGKIHNIVLPNTYYSPPQRQGYFHHNTGQRK
jgi:hypothetical protein